MKTLLATLLALAAVVPAQADDVASFYRGKQIRFVVGSAPGGTYDLLARIMAQHLPAHIPGHPSIIVQNQPSAAHYDSAKLIWLGSTHAEPYVAYVWHTAPVQSLDDVFTKPLIVAATTP